MTVTVTGVITLAPPAPTSPRRGNTPARVFQPELRGAAVRGPQRHRSPRSGRGPASSRPSRPARGRAGVRGRDWGEGRCALPNQPPNSPRSACWRPHFRRRPRGRGSGGPRAAPPAFRRGRRRPTWSRAGSRAGTPAQPDAGGVVGRLELVRRLRGGGTRRPILWKKILRFKEGLKAELGFCPIPHIPYTCTLLTVSSSPDPTSPT